MTRSSILVGRCATATLALVATAALPGCAFPANLTSGVELSWVATEVSGAEDSLRARTCEGAGVRAVVVRIVDRDDADRAARFQFECEAGFQSPDDFVGQLSDLFLDLREGSYRVEIRALGDDAAPIYEENRDVKVDRQQARIVRVTFAPDPVDLELDVRGAASCDALTGLLAYRDPASQLADFEAEEDDDDSQQEPVVYRDDLRSDRGLRLDGASQPCQDLGGGVHVFAAIDPGDYTLRLEGLSGGTCDIPVAVAAGAPAVRIELDLANPPC